MYVIHKTARDGGWKLILFLNFFEIHYHLHFMNQSRGQELSDTCTEYKMYKEKSSFDMDCTFVDDYRSIKPSLQLTWTLWWTVFPPTGSKVLE